jgi:hypothetical protein
MLYDTAPEKRRVFIAMSGTAAALAAEHYAHGQAVSQGFPSDLQEILQRRSSRDPSTRFARKLHALLSYVSANPHLEAEAGLGWIDDNVFRIFKPRLLGVLGLKLNTLNVNLRDLRFIQLQSDKSGWTRWRRDGFTRRELEIGRKPDDADPTDLFTAHRPPRVPADPAVAMPDRVGHLSSAQLEGFRDQVLSEWKQIVETTTDCAVASVFFVSKAAARYRLPQQLTQNSFDVIQAILTPQSTLTVKAEEFFRFMARFGPPETTMLKIHSLLEVATAREPWLYFGLTPITEGIVFGAFDEDEPNALVIRRGKVEIDRVWNLPLVPFGGHFVMDKDSRMYGSWEEYFRTNPVQVGGEIGYRS